MGEGGETDEGRREEDQETRGRKSNHFQFNGAFFHSALPRFLSSLAIKTTAVYLTCASGFSLLMVINVRGTTESARQTRRRGRGEKNCRQDLRACVHRGSRARQSPSGSINSE